mmetsp:Transcript_27546/g.38860  ORF Transcript_27546/g.38860 Transcript_27546/m.38860 type:complete len:328 (-) Transcript_27546:66-1049(-)
MSFIFSRRNKMSFIFSRRFSTLFKKKKNRDDNNKEDAENDQIEEHSGTKPIEPSISKKSKKILYIYDSTRPTYIDQIPPELKMEIVKHLEIYDVLNLGVVSKSWKVLVNKEALWKLQIEKTMNDGEILTPKFLEDNHVETWKEAYVFMSKLKWDEKCKDISRIEITENGRVVEDVGDYCRFCVARTAQGFAKGQHYWEVKVISGSCDAFNIYIGVSVRDLSSLWKLGTKPDESWAIRGCDGKIYFSEKTEDCAEPFKESDVIGVYLNMDVNPPAVCWYLHGRYSKVFRIPNIRGPRMLYPAVSMINKGEKLALMYPVPVPPGIPKLQ